MTNNLIFKRIGAFLIDYLIITFISAGLVYITFINPKYEEYQAASETYANILTDYYDGKINADEFSKQNTEISYDLNKSGYVYIIGNIAISLLYYGVFVYFTKGQTLGKRLMNIKIVSNKDKELKIYNYFIRTIILNGIIGNVITLTAICFSRNTYYQINGIGRDIISILYILIFVTVVINGRGLHDYIAGTKVISTKEQIEINSDKNLEIKKEEEVTIIKPKKKAKKEN